MSTEDKTIRVVPEERCTGCGACYNRCPVGAIKMEYNAEGFMFPVVDENICIDCGACQGACPEVNPKIIRESTEGSRRFFAVQAGDKERQESSSGGMFTLVARYILKQGGIVCGCRYADDYRMVYHTFAENEEALLPLKKSKYVQSETQRVYSAIEKYLKEDRWVLFSGTPCQVAGLYGFLDKDYPTLLTADIVCHGVPSVRAYQKWFDEYSAGKEVDYVDFRDRSIAPWGTVEFIKFKDGSHYYNDCYKGFFFKSFLSGVVTRKCCGTCRYAKLDRQGDITIGDFWGIGTKEEAWKDGKGTSLVIVNTRKMREIFLDVMKSNSRYEEKSEEFVAELAKNHNGNLLHPTPSHYARKRFFELIEKKSYSEALKDVLYARYDVGIVGWWYNLNYGGALTYYALHQLLRKMGLSVIMIAQPTENPDYKPDKNSVPYRFALKHYYISLNHSSKTIRGLNDHCKAFISGSDQLFNPVLWQWSGPAYFLDFVRGDRRKISVASSFGNRFYDIPELVDKMRYWLKRFDSLSVREDYGVGIARDGFGVEATKILDPVFLCDKQEYLDLAKQSKVREDEDFFVNFILDPSEEKKQIILEAERRFKLKYINLINADNIEVNFKRMNMENTKANADIEDWMYYYANSKFIITDSLHGTCFAIILHKPFISFANKLRGENRFISILGELGLMERMVYSYDELMEKEWLFEKPIDYDKVEEILKEKVDFSLKWIRESVLGARKKKTDFQMLDDKVFELEEKIKLLEKR